MVEPPELVTIVAMPTRYGAPAVPSHHASCSRCSEPVWLSNRSDVDLVTRGKVICVVCAMAVVEPGDLIQPAPWVAADLAARAIDDPGAAMDDAIDAAIAPKPKAHR